MKAILGLAVLALVIYGALHYGGLLDFDPAQQAKDARAAIKPGMSWQKVSTAAGKPGKCRFYVIHKKMIGGEEVEVTEPGPFMKYDATNLANRLDGGTLPAGFEFLYNFSANDSFLVKFDAAGDVDYVADAPTINKLLDM